MRVLAEIKFDFDNLPKRRLLAVLSCQFNLFSFPNILLVLETIWVPEKG